MPRQKDLRIIHGAAFYFAYVSRDINEIAKKFGVVERTVRRWAENDPEWHQALDAWGYKGDRNFVLQPKRDTARDTGADFAKAKEAYQNAFKAGEPPHKLATIASATVGLPRRRIHDWAMKYGWRENSFLITLTLTDFQKGTQQQIIVELVNTSSSYESVLDAFSQGFFS